MYGEPSRDPFFRLLTMFSMQVDQLMNWLDDRGDREKLLKTSLLRIYEPLKNSMVKRVTVR